MWEAIVVIFVMSFMVGFVTAIVGLFIGFIRKKWRVSIIGGIVCGASFVIMMLAAGMGGLFEETDEATSIERASEQLVVASTHIPTSAPQSTPVPPTPLPPTSVPPTLTPEPTPTPLPPTSVPPTLTPEPTLTPLPPTSVPPTLTPEPTLTPLPPTSTPTPVPPTPIPPTPTPEPTFTPTSVPPTPIPPTPTLTPVPPTPTPTPIDPEQILDDYLTNKTLANLRWKKGERLFVTLTDIDEIESEGRVQKSISLGGSFSFDFGFIELDFSKDADVIDLVPGDTVTAYCKFVGYSYFMRDRIEFEDCTRHR